MSTPYCGCIHGARGCPALKRSEERRVGKECRSLCDWSSDVCSSDLSFITEGASELRSANEGLRREIQRRKGLEGEILEIGDREQQRLGQELHDGLCQHLTAVAFMARAVALRLKDRKSVV